MTENERIVFEKKVLDYINVLVGEFYDYYNVKNPNEHVKGMIRTTWDRVEGAVKLAEHLGVNVVTSLVVEDGGDTHCTYFRLKK